MKKIISKFLIGLSIITPSCSCAKKKYIKPKPTKHWTGPCTRYRNRIFNEYKNRSFRSKKDEKYFKDRENRKIIKFDDFRRIVLEMKDKIKESYVQKLNYVNQNRICGSFKDTEIALPFSLSADDRAAPGLLNKRSMTLKEYAEILSDQCLDKSCGVSGRNYASMLWTKFHNLGYSVGICKVNAEELKNDDNFSHAKTVCVVPVEKNGNIVPYVLDSNFITNEFDSIVQAHNKVMQEWGNDFVRNPQDNDSFKKSLEFGKQHKIRILNGYYLKLDDEIWRSIEEVLANINSNFVNDCDGIPYDDTDDYGVVTPVEDPQDLENQRNFLFTKETIGLAYSLEMYTRLYHDGNFRFALYSNDRVNLAPAPLSITSYRKFVRNLPSDVFPYSLVEFNELINNIRNSGKN